tara:strand:+ start:1610 stop:1882 length:273 start_codon:yes stop_codon:yes gene_type:complete
MKIVDYTLLKVFFEAIEKRLNEILSHVIKQDKVFLTEKDAAAFLNVSLSQFRNHRESYNITQYKFMGKIQYSKQELIDCVKNHRASDTTP